MTTTQPTFFTSFSLFSHTSVKNDVVSFKDVTRETRASFTTSRLPLFPALAGSPSARAEDGCLYVKEGGGGDKYLKSRHIRRKLPSHFCVKEGEGS